ncbi:MAG: hypothetical protein HAW59_06190, partial [Betaproteobacteria bacterium]|nr:hypothetical protein [Betaproteobacteria bacterium]
MAYGVNLSRAGCRRRAADFFGGLPRRRQRGFVHVLLLVFTVLGVSLWGITEMLHRSQEATQKSEQKHSEAMTRARRALLNYAVLAPERLSVERRAGRYNAFWDGNNRNPYNLTEYVPHRYFAMPCPDSARDGNWDGASDSLVMTTVGIDIAECGNFRGGIYPGDGGSRVGRLPWRTELGEEGGRYLYIRGLGEDLVDRHGDRFWYAAAYNLLRNDRALNPH